MISNKKAISAVITTILLLLVAITLYLIVDSKYKETYTKILADSEEEYGSSKDNIELMTIKQESSNYYLYIKNNNYQNTTINSLIINNNTCTLPTSNIIAQKQINRIRIQCPSYESMNQVMLRTTKYVINKNVKAVLTESGAGGGSTPTVVETDGNFDLLSNGVVTCSLATVGDTGTLDGVTYTAVSNQNLSDKIGSNDVNFYETACTSLATTMNLADAWNGGVFYNANINPDISHWDTSSVTSMRYMFSVASSFNQPLDNFDTSNVTNMDSMFRSASSFNQSLDNFDTSSVTDMSSMFYGAISFNQPLNFDTSSVIYMAEMFSGASSFNQPLNFDTSSVTSMFFMFSGASSFNQNISSWCVPLIGSKPTDFDLNSGFAGQSAIQPQWGTCP